MQKRQAGQRNWNGSARKPSGEEQQLAGQRTEDMHVGPQGTQTSGNKTDAQGKDEDKVRPLPDFWRATYMQRGGWGRDDGQRRE